GDMFDSALGVMTETKSVKAASTLLSTTQNAEKFTAVSNAALSFAGDGPSKQELVYAVATGAAGALDETKAKWVDTNIDVATLRKIFGDMAKGLVPNADLRKAAYKRWKDVGKEAFDPFMASLATRSHVLEPGWV